MAQNHDEYINKSLDVLSHLNMPTFFGMFTYYAEADTTAEAKDIVQHQRPKQYDFNEQFKSALIFSRSDGMISFGKCHCSRCSCMDEIWEWVEESFRWNQFDWACACIDLTVRVNPFESVVRMTLDKSSKTMIVEPGFDNRSDDDDSYPELTKIYDLKPASEIFQDVCNDIEIIREWHSLGDVNNIKTLRHSIKCYNTSHGLDILIKLLATEDLNISIDQAVGVLLHDVCKYKNRTDIIEMLMSRYTGRECDEIANHGVNSAILILSAFPTIMCADMLFVFRHAKKNPYKCDASKLSLFEKAFFIFDDIIKDIKHYKHITPKQTWTDLQKFYYQPKLKLVEYIFDITKSLNSYKK